MRVIAGAAKGHNLQTIEGLATRPTTDRIKETLFNIIAFDLPEASFLDLFSGSGAIGIEALSRGAAEAVFVENAAECQKVIQANLVHTKLQGRARLLQTDVLSALDRLAAEGKKFDIIFMDPPYEAGLYTSVLERIAENGSSFPFYGFHTPVPTTSPPGQSPSAVPDSISSGTPGLFRCCRVLTDPPAGKYRRIFR